MRDRSAREGPARGARGSLSGSRIARLARTATATTEGTDEERWSGIFERALTVSIVFWPRFGFYSRGL